MVVVFSKPLLAALLVDLLHLFNELLTNRLIRHWRIDQLVPPPDRIVGSNLQRMRRREVNLAAVIDHDFIR